MGRLGSGDRSRLRRFLEEANELWLAYLSFAEALEAFARAYGAREAGELLLELEEVVLEVLRGRALKGFRRVSGLDVCLEGGPACDVVILEGRGSYRLFDTERVYVRTQEGIYAEESLLGLKLEQPIACKDPRSGGRPARR